MVRQKQVLYTIFATSYEAEILGKFSWVYEEKIPKISASYLAEKVVYGGHFSVGT